MKKIDIEKKIYECLGVNIFRKYVLFTWEKIAKLIKLNIGYRIKDKSVESLINYKSQSKGFAFAHALLLLIIIVTGIFNKPELDWWIINVGLNTYCIMVQRYTHIRINEILERIENKNHEEITSELIKENNIEKSLEDENIMQVSSPNKHLSIYENEIDYHEQKDINEEQGQSRILR